LYKTLASAPQNKGSLVCDCFASFAIFFTPFNPFNPFNPFTFTNALELKQTKVVMVFIALGQRQKLISFLLLIYY